jgi:16S rRNA (adenine1518-N6/adenine1519-N6)-dimethyltransferase
MFDDNDLQQARASAAADDSRRGLVPSTGQSSDGSRAASPSEPQSLAVRTRDLLRRHDLRPRKSFGQNFLLNPLKVEAIAAAALEAAKITGAGTIVEIGPGLGALTLALAEGGPAEARPIQIIAFEIDRALEAPLTELLAPHANVTVRFEDFLEADLGELLGGQPYVAAGNLPYNITAPLLEKLLMDPQCRALVITVQKEVADRLRAVPGTKAYGPLTLFCAYHVQAVEIVAQLHPGDFLPPPQVDSTALRLVKREKPLFEKPSAEAFERGVRGAFNHRRKSLRSGLALTTRLGLSREQVQEALDRAEISGERRAETLDMGEFARLAQALDEVRSDA